VVISGDKPAWMQNCYHISVGQNYAKHENVKNNLLAVCKDPKVSDDFVLMNDDFFIMKNIKNVPPLNRGPIDKIIQKLTDEGLTPNNLKKYKQVKKLLEDIGIVGVISYELHVPMVMNKRKCLKLDFELNEKRLYQRRTAYGNYYNISGKTIDDVKIYEDDRRNPDRYKEDRLEFLKNQTFLSVDNSAFYGQAGDFVKQVFCDKSQYEI
jgi:hypothetical protein